MKHKIGSISISRIVELFANESEAVSAVLYSGTSKILIGPEEFAAILLAVTDKTCENSFVLQKHLKSDLEVTVNLRFPDIVQVLQELPVEANEEVIGQSTRVMNFLNKNSTNLVSGKIEWVFFKQNWYLTRISTEKTQEVNVRSSSVISQNNYSHGGLNRKRIRPLSAFTEIVMNSKRGVSANSTRVLIRKKSQNDGFSQTDLGLPCKCKEIMDDVVGKLAKVLKENEEIEKILKLRREEGKTKVVEIEEKWKEKCLEVSKVISDKIYEEKVKFEQEFNNLKQTNRDI